VGILLIISIALYLTGLLSFQSLCGFRPGYMAKSGKELKCSCVGKVEMVITSYNVEEYCTGLNFSYNRLLNFYWNSNSQVPAYKPERL